MMQQQSTELEAAQALIQDIHAYVDRAQELVAMREPLALQGLNQSVDLLCQRMIALPLEVSDRYAGELAALRDRIDALGQQMRLYQGEILGAIQSLNRTKQANAAYAKQQPESAS